LKSLRSRRRWPTIAVCTVTLAMVVAPAQGAQAAPAAVAITEGTGIAAVIDRINTIGVLDYPTTYLADKPVSAHAIVIMDTAHNASFFRQLKKIDGIGEYSLTERRVPRSFAVLDRLTKQLATDSAALAQAGVSMSMWDTDIDTDTVEVTLRTDTGLRAAALSTARRDSAATVLSDRYGSGLITVSSSTAPASEQNSGGRDIDSSPWSAGDYYYTHYGTCTTGFGTKGKASGNYYILGAGHCGEGSATPMGTVATVYFTGGWDFETISPSGSAKAAVWPGGNNSTTSYKVVGVSIPASGSQVTIDGAATAQALGGERSGNVVNFVNGCVSESGYQVCNEYGSTHSGENCREGDSGGPVYVRSSPLGKAYAVGIYNSSNTNGNNCFWQAISPILTHANLSLVTTS
jgi:hypothetical protein